MTKIALVTGSAKRLGEAIALDLARRGFAIAAHYNASKAQAEAVAAAIRAQGGEVELFPADLGDPAEADALLPAVVKRMGAPNLLVNNASIFAFDTIESVTRHSWDAHIAVNLAAPLFLSQAFARHLPQGVEGNIVNMIDERVWKLTPNFTSYTVSKAGLWTLTQTLAQALAPRIRVNAIGPGPTLKSIHQSDEDFARQTAALPLERGAGLDEICSALAFFLETPSLTGQMIALDGGQHLAWQTPDIIEATSQRRRRPAPSPAPTPSKERTR
jgi:NAD(P)-dependent dehydrogenase (short-subunit alcohol dehydrogenase family)